MADALLVKQYQNIFLSALRPQSLYVCRYTFLGFGQGPRGCIGMRFALLEIKMAVFAVLRDFDLVVCESTPDVVVFDPENQFGAAKGGLWIKAKRREETRS